MIAMCECAEYEDGARFQCPECADLSRRREAGRGEPINLGLGEVGIGTAYAADDPQQIECEVVIYRLHEPFPVATALVGHVGKSSDDVDLLARFRVMSTFGARVLMEALAHAAWSAEKAKGATE